MDYFKQNQHFNKWMHFYNKNNQIIKLCCERKYVTLNYMTLLR